MRSGIVTFFMAVSLCSAALADDVHFTTEPSVRLDPNMAYVLVRAFERPCGWVCGHRSYAPILVRTLGSDELNEAEALARNDPDHWKDRVESNVVVPPLYAEQGTKEFLLTSLKPGTYVVGGLMGAPGGMQASLCMGTVKFEAMPAVITDLGTIINTPDDEPTTIPELSKYVTGKPMGDATFLEAVAITPVTSTTEVPEPLKSLPIAAADYSAVPAFPNYLQGPLMRLAPLAGVLAYDKDGQVIDVKAEQSGRR